MNARKKNRILRVNIALFRDVKARVLAAIQKGNRDCVYTVIQLYGPADWTELPKGDRLRAGVYLAYMVTNGQVPLEFAVCPHSVPKKYRLK